jgi:hypothetical protein
VSGFDVPHRKQPDQLLADLKAGYIRSLVATDHPALAAPPSPGGKLDPSPKVAPVTLRDEADRLAGFASHQLFSGDAGCAKCHQTAGAGDALRVSPVPDRKVWFTHAKFNHASHRTTACATCHPGTGAAYSTGKVTDNEPVQILGVESCRTCHSPADTRVTLADGSQLTGGGVRHNCTDCHSYHNGDYPLQGRGADPRLPSRPRDLSDFLKGK